MATSIVVEPSNVTITAGDVFAALAEPVRLRILQVLADASQCVCDIREQVPIAPNLLSYHLRVLRQAGLVAGSRRGRWIDYRVAPGAAALLATSLGAAGFPALIEQTSGCSTDCEDR